MSRSLRVLRGVGGGIAAYKSAELVRRLRSAGHEVRCALSRSAVAFMPPLTLEVLSGQAVYQQEWLEAGGSGQEIHVEAAAWADVLLVAPATAHLLARLALGLADDFLTTTALVFPGPLVLAPAMHHEMWAKSAVEQNVATLAARGARFVGPVLGPLASGEVGMGRMAEPVEIVEALAALGGHGPLAGKLVVVSAGPTREPLDPVRYLGNHSSGKMGFALAAAAVAQGARVVLVAGPVALDTPRGVERVDVGTALEMEQALHRVATTADLVVMTAAVADFRARRVAREKIKKDQGVPTIELERNPDLLTGLAAVAPQALRVGFAAETESIEHHALAKLEKKRAHLIVANDVGRPGIGFGAEDNEVTVYRRSGPPIFLPRQDKRRLAAALMDLFAEELRQGARCEVGAFS